MLAPTSRWGTSSSSTENPQTIGKPSSLSCPKESHSPCHHRWPCLIHSSAVQALPFPTLVVVRCSLYRLPPQHRPLTHCTTLPRSAKNREEHPDRLLQQQARAQSCGDLPDLPEGQPRALCVATLGVAWRSSSPRTGHQAAPGKPPSDNPHVSGVPAFWCCAPWGG